MLQGGCRHGHAVVVVRHIACFNDAVQLFHHAFHLFLLCTHLRFLRLVMGGKSCVQTCAQLLSLLTQLDDELWLRVLAELGIIYPVSHRAVFRCKEPVYRSLAAALGVSLEVVVEEASWR